MLQAQKLLELEGIEVKAEEEPKGGDNNELKWGGTKTPR